MNSNNNTINKFGIEYSYIALAMNNMLGFTNNNIKNINIDKTNAIAIDWGWGCVLSILALVLIIIGFVALLGGLAVATGLTGWAAVFFWVGLMAAISSIGLGVYIVGNACFGGW